MSLKFGSTRRCIATKIFSNFTSRQYEMTKKGKMKSLEEDTLVHYKHRWKVYADQGRKFSALGIEISEGWDFNAPHHHQSDSLIFKSFAKILNNIVCRKRVANHPNRRSLFMCLVELWWRDLCVLGIRQRVSQEAQHQSLRKVCLFSWKVVQRWCLLNRCIYVLGFTTNKIMKSATTKQHILIGVNLGQLKWFAFEHFSLNDILH